MVQTVASLTADPGVASSIPAWSNTLVEIDHEIFSTVILLLPLIQERAVISYKRMYAHKALSQVCPGKSVVMVNMHDHSC